MALKSKYISIGIVVCSLIVLATVFSTGVFGISANNIEQDARKSQKIESTWEMAKSINDKLCAMIFYNDTFDEFIFSIYVNRGGFSFGYFFKTGGSASNIMDGIHEFKYDINGSAIISMNKDKVTRIDIDNGIDVTKIEIDPSKPFAIVIPVNSGSVMLYDINENVVPITVISYE